MYQIFHLKRNIPVLTPGPTQYLYTAPDKPAMPFSLLYVKKGLNVCRLQMTTFELCCKANGWHV